jgi:hypothetical protein
MAERAEDEDRERLWILAAPPALWALHFLLSYATAAVWCAKVVGLEGSLLPVRIAVGVYTAVALGAVFVIGAYALRHQRIGAGTARDEDSAASRHRFLAHATLLLSGLSAIAILYAALAVVFIGDCR